MITWNCLTVYFCYIGLYMTANNYVNRFMLTLQNITHRPTTLSFFDVIVKHIAHTLRTKKIMAQRLQKISPLLRPLTVLVRAVHCVIIDSPKSGTLFGQKIVGFSSRICDIRLQNNLDYFGITSIFSLIMLHFQIKRLTFLT